MRKSGPREIPPPLELECLKALWKLKSAQVRDVRREVTHDRKLAYTTVMTILERLARKGAVARRKEGRCFVYEPVLTRDFLRDLAVKQLVDSFFEGSNDKLAEYLAEAPTSPATFAAAAGNESRDTAPQLDTSLL